MKGPSGGTFFYDTFEGLEQKNGGTRNGLHYVEKTSKRMVKDVMVSIAQSFDDGRLLVADAQVGERENRRTPDGSMPPMQ